MAALDAWLCFEDEAGFSMTPSTARTWARRGRSQRRFSIAALACYKHGERSRLIHRPKRHPDHKRGGRRSFTWTDYRDLLIAAHQQLGSPIVLVWDNLNVHKDRRLRELIDAHVCCSGRPPNRCAPYPEGPRPGGSAARTGARARG